MEYTIHGPFEIKRQGKTVNHLATELKKFWSEIDEQFEGLSFACGCYLFALKAGKGSTPWYVGKAEKQSFSKEVFNSHKVQYYNDIIANQKGKPIIFILAKRTRKKKFVKPSKNGHSDIDFLETLLIGAALGKNRDLLNKKKI